MSYVCSVLLYKVVRSFLLYVVCYYIKLTRLLPLYVVCYYMKLRGRAFYM